MRTIISSSRNLILAPLFLIISGCGLTKTTTSLKFSVPESIVEKANIPKPELSWTQSVITLPETAGSVTLTAKLSHAYPLDVDAPVSISPVIGGFEPGFIHIPAGSTSADLIVPIVDDSVVNGRSPRFIMVSLGNSNHATQGLNSTVRLDVMDDEKPVIRYSTNYQILQENAGIVTLQAEIDRPFSSTKTLEVRIRNEVSTATPDQDYVLPNGFGPAFIPGPGFVFQPGATTATTTLTVMDDQITESVETIVLSFDLNPASPVIAHPKKGKMTLNILDNDFTTSGSLPKSNGVSFAPFSGATPLTTTTPQIVSFTASEADGTLTIPVVLNQPVATDTVVPLTISTAPDMALAGTDFLLKSGNMTIPAGSRSGTFDLILVNRDDFRGTRKIQLDLGSTSNNLNPRDFTRLVVSIQEDDPIPGFSFVNEFATVVEGAGTVSIPIALSGISSVNMIANWTSENIYSNLQDPAAQYGADYEYANPNKKPSVVVPAGTVRSEFKILIKNDSINEDTEAITGLMLPATASLNTDVAPGGGYLVTQIRILDDDPEVEVQWSLASQSVGESSGRAQVTATLSAVAGKSVHIPFEVSGSATLNQDFFLGGQEVIIPTGKTSATIDIPILLDSVTEPEESIILTLMPKGNARIGTVQVHTIRISDSSGPIPSLASFKATVWALVRAQNCINCHIPRGQADFARFASSLDTEAYEAALSRADFTNIPASKFVTRLMANHQGNLNLSASMITAIQNWRDGVTTPPPGSGSDLPVLDESAPSAGGSIALQDFMQFEASLNLSISGKLPTTFYSNSISTTRTNLSGDGNILDFSVPMASAYVAMGAEYCTILVDEVSGTAASNKRGFDQIPGLSNFKADKNAFLANQALQDQVSQKFSDLFLHRPATSAELLILQDLVKEQNTLNPATDTKTLAKAMCTVISGSLDAIAN